MCVRQSVSLSTFTFPPATMSHTTLPHTNSCSVILYQSGYHSSCLTASHGTLYPVADCSVNHAPSLLPSSASSHYFNYPNTLLLLAANHKSIRPVPLPNARQKRGERRRLSLLARHHPTSHHRRPPPHRRLAARAGRVTARSPPCIPVTTTAANASSASPRAQAAHYRVGRGRGAVLVRCERGEDGGRDGGG